jgi:hypothetical protein
MTQENREKMQRAIGIIEGVSWTLKTIQSDALREAVEILDEVLESESENK